MESRKSNRHMRAGLLSFLAGILFSVFLLMGTAEVHAVSADPGDLETYTDDEHEKRIVYKGKEDLSDEDALVLVMYGDGFTSAEQDAFFAAAEDMAEYIIGTSPWDEVKDAVKIYAVSCNSNESGIKGENCSSYYDAYYDTKDTYFGTMFWYYGTERLVYFADEYAGESKVAELTEKYVPKADYEIIVANSTKYGGSGGNVCAASLNEASMEILVHELGHSVADLADEYYGGDYYAGEYANMTSVSDPEDMSQYFIIRKGSSEATGDTLGEAITLTYYAGEDTAGTPLDGAPSAAGTYTVQAVFTGNDEYAACEQTGTYTIDPTPVTLTCSTKVYDGTPASATVFYDADSYDVVVSYSGYQYTYNYDSYSSTDAPILPGNYWVQADIYEKGGSTIVMSREANFQIRIRKTAITNNNDAYYAGANSYYNNKTILITGEGFTAEEQDKFEVLAQEYVSYLRGYEPLKECDSYFNYCTVEAVSNTSGICRKRMRKKRTCARH